MGDASLHLAMHLYQSINVSLSFLNLALDGE